MNGDVDRELSDFFRRVPPPDPSDRLHTAVIERRLVTAPGRRAPLRFSGTVASLVGLAATMVIAAALLVVATGRPGRPGVAGSSASASAGIAPSASPSASAGVAASPAERAREIQSATPVPVATTTQPAARSGVFAATGQMIVADGYFATPLLDGRVLVTGAGAGSAELYDPATGSFSRTGTMSTDRDGATVTRLLDGRVLIAGGVGSDVQATAELFDPKTGKFTRTGSMTAARTGHTATLLADGRVLIAGGMPPVGRAMIRDPWSHGDVGGPAMTGLDNLRTAEIYDPRTGKFSRTGSMGIGRRGHTATLLADGRVLVVGGASESAGGDGPALDSAELYDPASGRFVATGKSTAGHLYHTATLLKDGRVLIAGGIDGSGQNVTTAETYDPATARFAATGALREAREYHAATLLPDGRVLVTGGLQLSYAASAGGGWSLQSIRSLDTAELFDPASGQFEAAGNMVGSRYGHAAALMSDGRVLVAGGGTATRLTDMHPVGSAETYTP